MPTARRPVRARPEAEAAASEDGDRGGRDGQDGRETARSTRTLRLEYLPLDSLVAADVNPKRHDLGKLAAALDAFGYLPEPIALDERTGRLLAGHGRVDQLRASQAAQLTAPDGVHVDSDGRWHVPVTLGYASANDAEATAAAIALNRISEVGGWETTELTAALDELLPIYGEATGYSTRNLQELLDELTATQLLDVPMPKREVTAAPPAYAHVMMTFDPSLHDQVEAFMADVPAGVTVRWSSGQ